MFIGVLLGIAAGALWGLIYIGPLLVPQYNPVLIALGRFIAFGLVSLPCLYIFRKELKMFNRADIWEAFKLPFFGNVVFYSLLTICIRLAGAPLAGMFMAVIPVLVAIVSNFRYKKEGKAVSWSKILPPLAVIFFGLVMANWSEFKLIQEESAKGGELFWVGVGFGIAAVAAWTWFSIYNADWLLAHPHHSTSAWTALQGVTVLPVVVIAFAVLAWPLEFMDTSTSLFGPEPATFLGVALMIGFLCSWVAMLAWNQMSQRLPAALGGQLIVFESVFAVVYSLIYRGELPTMSMVVGFAILLAGVLGSLRVFQQPQDDGSDKEKKPNVDKIEKAKVIAAKIAKSKDSTKMKSAF